MNIEGIELLIRECADAHYDKFEKQGYADPGCNGPYGCVDTPVRNTGHWLIIYAYLWKTKGEDRYGKLALRFADYLLHMQNKSRSGAVACMEEGGSDRLNGLIGQAWTIEALVYAYQTFGKDQYLDCALRIFRSQKFDAKAGLWKRVDVDGTAAGYDMTLNHQVWFGIAGLMLLQCIRDQDIERQVRRHLYHVRHEYFGIHKDGLIQHFGAMKHLRKNFLVFYLKQYMKYAGLALGLLKADQVDILIQEEGYHIFELYGYAHIALLYEHEPMFRSRAFAKAVDYAMNLTVLNKKLGIAEPERMNRYAYGYNAPAFEWPLVQLVFTGETDERRVYELLELQKNLTYNKSLKAFDRNTNDPLTLTARLYELVIFCECCKKVNLSEKERKK